MEFDPKRLPEPAAGMKIYPVPGAAGLGVRVTAAGARAFVLRYKVRLGAHSGTSRTYTLGPVADWKLASAKAHAADLRYRVSRGEDPVGEQQADRNAVTMADLCHHYEAEHLPHKRPLSQRHDLAMIRDHVRPALGRKHILSVTHDDIARLHRDITASCRPIVANRVCSLLAKMFSEARRKGWTAAKPCEGIRRNPETRRERYLSPDELDRLSVALEACQDRQAVAIIRLLLLTGARRGEVLTMEWSHVDLAAGRWTKPSSHTKQKKLHRVPLSPQASELLSALRAEAERDAVCVFPGIGEGGHREGIRKPWLAICQAAGLHDFRLHDLRHTYASYLVSAGEALPTIGALLGHTQAATTHRYAHLMDAPLRAATDRVGKLLGGGR